MKQSRDTKKLLVREIQIVREMMEQEEDARNKAFYYSALFSEVSRLFNIEYTPHLQFMHLVLSVTYNAMLTRINLINSGDRTVPIPENFFDELDKLLERMQENIVKDEPTFVVLEKISNLVHLLSGNGYYLTQKGVEVFSP